ncbi:MAG: hypothetical protein KUF75_11340 [Candidatus Thiodiazotropha sp. (ex Ctena orbiculata)]|nr:hypothetical protein [Candidatus Thiodiazotropha taylori]
MAEPTKLLPLDVRHFPAYFALVVLGIVLLVFRDLSDDLRHYMAPSLLVYSLGSSFVSHLHVTLGNRAKRANKEQINIVQYSAVMLAHLAWLGLFIGYNYYYIYYVPIQP